MSSDPQNFYHLSDEHKYYIKFRLQNQITPEQIIEEWNKNHHHRIAPSVQTIYSIKRKMDNGDTVQTKKKGPKKKSVLTEKKLEEIDKVVEENDSLTNESLAKIVKIPESTVRRAKKILNIKKFNAVKVQKLSQAHQELRVSFCFSFIRWNHQYQMRIW